MPITDLKRQKRKKFIGSSDAAAVLGLDPYRAPIDVYYDKTFNIISNGSSHNDAIEVGNWCEDAVLKWFSDKHNLSIIRNQFRVHDNGIMAANIDALVKNDPTQAIEAKTTGIISRYIGEEWGEVETDQVPERIALQCQHQMAVIPTLQTVWVPVLMGGIGLRHYRVERNEEMIRDLTMIEEAFWRDHVEKMTPPGGMPSLDTLKHIKRKPNKTVDLSDALVELYMKASDDAKAAADAKEEMQKALINALGDAECGKCTYGTYNYLMQSRKEYTIPAGQFRKLTFKKAKGTPNE